jgi:glycosyltransferase involved in cell wall biosynthesis
MISVIVPAYNAARTLAACLEALQGQTQAADEIVVVDDGSDDQTIKIAGEFGIKVLEQSHMGPAAARNLGVTQACGDIILFTDADCEPTPNWIAEMQNPFFDPQVSGVKGSYCTRQKESVARLVQCEFEERYDRQERSPTIDVVDTYAAGFRHAVLIEMGSFDPAFPHADNEDVELSYRLERAGCRLVFNRKAVVYHRHPSTWRAYLCRKIKRGYWRMMVYRLYPRKAFHDSYTPQILKLQIALIYLLFVLFGVSVAVPLLSWGVAATLVGLCLSAIPFIRRAVRQDHGLAPAALLFIIVRALAFAIGVAGGIVGMIFFRPKVLRNDKER